MYKEKKSPVQFGIRVLDTANDLGITAANKMRNTKQKFEFKSFYGSLFETPCISRNLDEVEKNISSTINFLDKIKKNQRNSNVEQHPYFNNVGYEEVKQLIESLIIPIGNENYFDKKQILSNLENEKDTLKNFDVLVIGGLQKLDGKANPFRFKYDRLDIDIPLIGRMFDVRYGNIRMGGHRRRLGGSSDTKYGLDKSQIPLTHSKAQDYLIEERNPLLIIYFVKPTISKESNIEESNVLEMKKLDSELKTRKYPFIVGYALGIPQKEGAPAEKIKYVVNKTNNYYEKDHDNESEEI
jgi:hypothetical protein